MHTTPNARFAIVGLLSLAGLVALARDAEARWGRRPPGQEAVTAPVRPSGEGDQLREGRPLDLNRASAAELELLPSVGPRIAREIVELRKQKGAFRALAELEQVRGIGPRTLEKIRPFVQLSRVASEGLEHSTQP